MICATIITHLPVLCFELYQTGNQSHVLIYCLVRNCLIILPLALLKCFKNPFTMDFCRNPISKHYSDARCIDTNI